MYPIVLALHSALRWLVLVIGVVAVVRAVSGVTAGRTWDPSDERASRWLAIALDVQVLIGLILYLAFSPLTAAAFRDMAAAMATSTLRYWAVEHPFGAIVGLALVHIGRARIRRAPSDAARHRTIVVFFTLALLAILVSIPWPWMSNGRALLPGA